MKRKPFVRTRAIKLTPEDELVALTRDLERLRRERRKWNRKLKATDTELRAVRREHKALLMQVKSERAPDIVPSRLHGGATGFKRVKELKPSDELYGSSFDPDFEKHSSEFVNALDPPEEKP